MKMRIAILASLFLLTGFHNDAAVSGKSIDAKASTRDDLRSGKPFATIRKGKITNPRVAQT